MKYNAIKQPVSLVATSWQHTSDSTLCCQWSLSTAYPFLAVYKNNRSSYKTTAKASPQTHTNQHVTAIGTSPHNWTEAY